MGCLFALFARVLPPMARPIVWIARPGMVDAPSRGRGLLVDEWVSASNLANGASQRRAMVVHPVRFEMLDEMVVGADSLHRVLVGWLERLGHGTSLHRAADRD
jgi:hypothetical protein